jgi:SUMO ligase MMS21 Smc5/6 complex component
MEYSNQVILQPCELKQYPKIDVDFVLKKEKQKVLVSGTLLDSTGNIMQNAVLKVTRCLVATGATEELGFAVSDEIGKFYILMDKGSEYNYYIEVYEPLAAF